MIRPLFRPILAALFLSFAGVGGLFPLPLVIAQASQSDSDMADLAEFCTTETAITARISLDPPSATHAVAYLGLLVVEQKESLKVEHVEPGSPAARAGLQPGDLVVQIEKSQKLNKDSLRDIVHRKAPGDVLDLVILRGEQRLPIQATLAATSRPLFLDSLLKKTPSAASGGGNFDFRTGGYWKKDTYRLAVVPVEFADVQHNPQITPSRWEEALFSRGTYNQQSATGQTVYGSLNDYFAEQSHGQFRLTGKVFANVPLSKERGLYSQGKKAAFFDEALELLLAREGADALKEFDGIFFLYAGARSKTVRGGLFWPHRSTHTYKGKRWSYFINPEGGDRMDSISVLAHEFGHMLGLPDLYAQPGVNPAGLGVWCTMSIGHGKTGKPLHLSAWCKEKLGWIQPTIIDPTTPQKLILAPVMKSAHECYKILVRPDGSEYLLLENRVARGFDQDLPGQGLLIWRVVNDRPILEEAHGVTSSLGPRVFLGAVPYPNHANNAFTPYTTPSSQSPYGGGLPVHITNIQRLPDGRITFFIGFEYY